MHDHEPGTKLPGFPRQRGDFAWRDMGDLHTRNEGDGEALNTILVELYEMVQYLREIGCIHVIGDRDCSVRHGIGASQHLARKQDAVAQQ